MRIASGFVRACAALALLAILVWTLDGLQQRRAAPDPALLRAEERPRYAVGGAHWTRYGDDGAAVMQVSADAIDWYDDDSAGLRRVAVDAPTRDAPRWHLEAPTGRVDAGEPVLQLLGPVTGRGHWPDGRPAALQTPSVDVNWATHTLRTEAGVTLSGPTRRGSARRLSADWRDRSVDLSGDVRIEYVLD